MADLKLQKYQCNWFSSKGNLFIKQYALLVIRSSNLSPREAKMEPPLISWTSLLHACFSRAKYFSKKGKKEKSISEFETAICAANYLIEKYIPEKSRYNLLDILFISVQLHFEVALVFEENGDNSKLKDHLNIAISNVKAALKKNIYDQDKQTLNSYLKKITDKLQPLSGS